MTISLPDSVVDQDSNVIVKDTPSAVREWLEWHPSYHKHFVVIGRLRQVVTVREYLERK